MQAEQPLPAQEQLKIEQAFEKTQTSTRTFAASFKQTLRLEGVRDPVVSSGKFYYAAPDSMLIDFEKPKGEFVLLKGGELVVKKQGKPALRRRVPPEEWEHGPMMLLELFRNGGRRFQEKYDTRMQPDSGELIVTLTRRQDDENLPQEIENRLLARSMLIKSVVIRFDSEQTMSYEFLKPVRDADLSPSLFQEPQAR